MLCLRHHQVLHHKSVNMVQVFNQDMKITQGGEHVRKAKLRPSSHVTRYYAGCCSTPVGLSPDIGAYPIIICYKELFGSHQRILGPHTWCLFTSRQYPEASDVPAELTRGGEAVCSRGVSASFLMRVIFRVFYGLLLGRGSPSPKDAFTCPDTEIVTNDTARKNL